MEAASPVNFRVSGSGDFFYYKSLMTKQIIYSAFEVSDNSICNKMALIMIVITVLERENL